MHPVSVMPQFGALLTNDPDPEVPDTFKIEKAYNYITRLAVLHENHNFILITMHI